MESLYQTYLTGLLSAKVGLSYWKKENEKNPTDVTLKQVQKMLEIIADYEQKIEKLVVKANKAKSFEDWIDWFGNLISFAREILKALSKT